MKPSKPGWTDFLKRHGSEYRDWLAANDVLRRSFDELAATLEKLVRQFIQTQSQAEEVWRAAPAVLSRCNEQSTYEMPGAPFAYAWLHLLDRYTRTWRALEELVEESCLPLGKHGVRTLDVGTGPGPSAFAIHDFYAGMCKYAAETGNALWHQPPSLTCVEFDSGTNRLRHLLAEFAGMESGDSAPGRLTIASSLHDFRSVLPTAERRAALRALRSADVEYFDEASNEWVSELLHSPEEANEIAQDLHRYRLIVFSNFLTTIGSVQHFESNLVDVLADAGAGSVLLVLGGKGPPYPDIYEYVAGLATTAGFQLKVAQISVSAADTVIGERVHEERIKIFDHLKELAPNAGLDEEVARFEHRFTDGRREHGASQVWAFRKY